MRQGLEPERALDKSKALDSPLRGADTILDEGLFGPATPCLDQASASWGSSCSRFLPFPPPPPPSIDDGRKYTVHILPDPS